MMPDKPGIYKLSQQGEPPYLVGVYPCTKTELWVECPYLGETPLAFYYDGLPTVEWTFEAPFNCTKCESSNVDWCDEVFQVEVDYRGRVVLFCNDCESERLFLGPVVPKIESLIQVYDRQVKSTQKS